MAFKPCILDGVEYPSRLAAAEALGLSPATICERIKKQLHGPAAQRYEAFRRPRAKTVSKKRACLMCKETFSSRHSGERVCTPCKQTPTWRDGMLGETVTSGRRV